MGRLLLLFIVVPAVELVLLIEVGERIGTLPTVGLIVATGVVGASLARWQGIGVLLRLQRETAEGRLPADSLVDGAFIVVAGALLVTPGVLTDAVGLLFLLPGFRTLAKRALWRQLERAIREQRVQMHVHFEQGFPEPGTREPGPIVDVEPVESAPEPDAEESGRDGSGSVAFRGRGPDRPS